ncbi:MAG: Parallel beta-helix repeat protein [Mucilaginibacter sp.]|nr:Parallel beta-helix repeat protein [Mucilaginibacter sp.]
MKYYNCSVLNIFTGINKQVKVSIALFFCLLNYSPSLKAQSVHEIYVAVNGSSSAPGTEAQPVNDIANALKLAATVAQKGAGKIDILVRGGTYYTDKTLEIIQGKTWDSAVPLSIEAYKNEVVILHGGKTISNDLIQPVTDKKWLARFQPAVRNKIREIDLKTVGIDPGVLRPVGFGRPMAPSWMEVFLNGNPGRIARWPNTGTVPIDSVFDIGTTTGGAIIPATKTPLPKQGLIGVRPSKTDRTVVVFKPNAPLKQAAVKQTAVKPADTTNRGGTFMYTNRRPSLWKEPSKIWLTGFFMWGYADDALPVAKIDTVKRIITAAIPTRYGIGSGKPFRAYYAYNIPEEIDLPGEYYVDSDTRMLYFLPPDTLKSVELSMLEDPIIDIRGISKVKIKNIQFTCSRGMGIYLEKTKDVRIDGCKFTNLGMMAIFMGKKGIEPTKDEKVKKPVVPITPIVKNTVDIINYLYDNTTYDSEGGTNNGIVNCKVYNTGMGGIYMSGGNRVKLEAAHNFVKNCLIHDYNRIEKTYRPGIYIAGVGNSISNCEIYNAPSVAILLHGNNHIIEYNIIHNTTLEVDDMGAIYYGRDPSERGNIVRYNYFHNLGGQHKTMAIYHDDGACGMTVIGNVFYKAGTVAGFIGGGQDNNYINNIFIDMRYVVHIDKRLNNWAKSMIQKDGLFRKRMDAVNYTAPPYATAYPGLKDYFTQGPDSPQRNWFYRNVLVNIQHTIEGDSTLIYFDKHNLITKDDPGFKNYAGLDFRLKRNSIIYSKLPGFIPPPLDKMGYHETK